MAEPSLSEVFFGKRGKTTLKPYELKEIDLADPQKSGCNPRKKTGKTTMLKRPLDHPEGDTGA